MARIGLVAVSLLLVAVSVGPRPLEAQPPKDGDRLNQMEKRVAALEKEVADLRAQLNLPPRPAQPSPTTVLVVRSVKPADDSLTSSRSFVVAYGLTAGDLEQIRKVPGVAGVTPVRLIPSEVRLDDRLAGCRVVGTTPEYPGVLSLKAGTGRLLTDKDGDDKAAVCVIGAGVAEKLSPDADPLGKSLLIRGTEFRVVGVLAKSGGDADHDVLVPLATSRGRFGEVIVIRTAGTRTAEKVELSEIIVRVTDPNKLAGVGDAVREVLKKTHPQQDWDVVTR